jgi:competence protein ComFB
VGKTVELKNHMEYLVNEALENYLKNKKDICKCESCILDMKANALNKLPPHYVVTSKGYLYGKLDEMRMQFNVDILKAVVEAVDIVSKHPRHNKS